MDRYAVAAALIVILFGTFVGLAAYMVGYINGASERKIARRLDLNPIDGLKVRPTGSYEPEEEATS